MPTLLMQPEWLKVPTMGAPEAVDRKAKVIRGYVVARAVPFKTDGRGEFDRLSIAKIVELGNGAPMGLKSRFGHPTASDDGLGKFLGRSRNFRESEEGGIATARADLHLSADSFRTPNGDLGGYVLNRAQNDPESLSSSLVLRTEKEQRLDARGRPAVDINGKALPPLWRPTVLHASDIVDTGEAVDGLLSAGIDIDGLPDAEVRRGAELLDAAFDGQPPEVIRARAIAWLDRYLSVRFPVDEDEGLTAIAARARIRRRMIESRQTSL